MQLLSDLAGEGRRRENRESPISLAQPRGEAQRNKTGEPRQVPAGISPSGNRIQPNSSASLIPQHNEGIYSRGTQCNDERVSPTKYPGSGRAATAVLLLVVGYSDASACPNEASSALTCSRVAPDLIRAIASRKWSSRSCRLACDVGSSSFGVKVSQRSVDSARTGNWKPCGITPIIVKARPFRLTVRPITLRSELKCERQKESLKTARCWLDLSSSSKKVLPTAACTPNKLNKLAETVSPWTCTASPRVDSVTSLCP